MRRRDVLRAAGAGVALPVVGRAAATQADYGPLGRVGAEGAKEAVIGGDGTTVYVAASDGFAVVDVSDPAQPELRHENRAVLEDHEDGPLTGIGDAKVDGDRLSLAGPIEPGTALQAAVVYDVADPSNPERVTFYETDYFLHNHDIADGRLYLCENFTETNRLVVVDVESGERLADWSVTEVDERWADIWPGLWTLHDVTVRGDRAYLAYWDAGTFVLDVSDPTDPSLVTKVRGRTPDAFEGLSRSAARNESTRPPGNDHYVAVNDDASVIAISVEAWQTDDGAGGPGADHLYDVSEPAAPEEVAVIDPPPTDGPTYEGVWTTSHNCDFAGDRLYTSWYRGGVKMHDVSDPSSPEELAAWRDSERASFWTAQAASTCFVGSSRKDPRQVESPAGDGPGAAIYTFPTDPGATPPPLETPTPTETETGTPTPTQTETHGTNPTPSPTESESPTPTDGQPGFGLGGGGAALGYGAWRLLGDDE
jgi:hypothetical protein